MSLRVFSFYTSELYKENAETMAVSARFFGLDVELIERPDLGTWWQNCNQKCLVVLSMIQKYPDDQLVWTDADCRYLAYPNLFQRLTDYDLAMFHINNTHPHSGVMLLNGKKALPYVEAWIKFVANAPTMDSNVSIPRSPYVFTGSE